MRPDFRLLRVVPWGLIALGLSGAALAQYKVVGPDGRVTYSDQPVPGAAAVGAGTPGDAATAASRLPADLRRAMGRYPVTLYASKSCAPCDTGRQLLQQRGVPFAEKRVESPADIQALQRLSGATSLPLLTVGNQQLKGLVAADWQGYLDAAGYPATSKLPASWRNPAPTPLVAAQAATSDDTAPAPAAPPRNDAATPAPPADPDKPRIRF